MGNAGSPVDHKAEKERRTLACRLLDQGLPPRMVARQCGRSNSWVYAVRKAHLSRKEAARASVMSHRPALSNRPT